MFQKMILITLICLPTLAFSKPCEVYGISDSPQKLNCQFQKEKVILDCIEGIYTINDAKVIDAFHMEVESGPNPMVFQNADTTLTIIKLSDKNIRGTLEVHSQKLKGTCQLP